MWRIILMVVFASCVSGKTLAIEASKFDKPVLIAVASNFEIPFKSLIKNMPSPAQVKIVSGSTGSLYAQIISGAPYDVLFAADTRRPQALLKRELALEVATYAIGQLVIFPSDNQQNLLVQLTNADMIAIANPETAPFGYAGMQVLSRLGINTCRVVRGNSVMQAYQFVQTRNADIGLLAKSTLIHGDTMTTNDSLNYQPISSDLYDPIVQQAALLTSHPDAKRILEYILSDPAQTKLLELGYMRVDDKVVKDD